MCCMVNFNAHYFSFAEYTPIFNITLKPVTWKSFQMFKNLPFPEVSSSDITNLWSRIQHSLLKRRKVYVLIYRNKYSVLQYWTLLYCWHINLWLHLTRLEFSNQYNAEHMHSVIHQLLHKSTPTCFGTKMPSSGSYITQVM